MRRKSPKRIRFTSFKRRQIEGSFDGGEVSSDGGLVLIRKADRRLGLLSRVARRLVDGRPVFRYPSSLKRTDHRSTAIYSCPPNSPMLFISRPFPADLQCALLHP